MRNKLKIILLAAFLLLGSITAAQAVLVSVGPADPLNGFPTYYQDGNGIALTPCFADPINCVLLGGSYPGDPFDPLLPIVFTSNFPAEFFYFIAEPDPAFLPTIVKRIRFALEGSFATLVPIPAAGQQAVFSRLRIRITPPDPTATYTVTHPFGVTSVGPADLKNGLYNLTIDIPAPTALDFVTALNGNVGPFLQWDPAIAPPAPAGFIGDNLTPHPVVGSTTGNNFVQIDGPGIPPAPANKTDLFVVAGQIFAGALPGALAVDRATYDRTTTTGTVSVFAHSTATATVTFQGGPNLPAVPQPMTGDATGQFFGQAVLADASVLPPTVTVNAVDGVATATATVPLIDIVTISSAVFELTTNTLTVVASSSDKGLVPATLTLSGFGPMPGGVGTFATPNPPGSVIVTSSAGGQATAAVILGSAVALPAPVAVDDFATTTIGTAVPISVLNNDTGSFSASTVAVVGGPIAGTAAVDATTGVVTYTPNAGFVGTDIFNYTVSGPGGLSNAATVTVTVTSPVTTEVLTITKAVYVVKTSKWDIQGTSSALSTATVTNWITAHLGNVTGPQIGQAAAVPRNVASGGAWKVSDRGSNVIPAPGSSVTVVSTFGTTATFPVTIK